MCAVRAYDRGAAVAYAHRWAFRRNPAYLDYDDLGGDCTSFASQCLFAGSGVMDFTPVVGWYYLDGNRKAPAWTGVPFLWDYLVRKTKTPGPFGVPCAVEDLRPGDIVQLRFGPGRFRHTPVVVSVGTPAVPDSILIAAHSNDADRRPLSAYTWEDLRCCQIAGVRLP